MKSIGIGLLSVQLERFSGLPYAGVQIPLGEQTTLGITVFMMKMDLIVTYISETNLESPYMGSPGNHSVSCQNKPLQCWPTVHDLFWNPQMWLDFHKLLCHVLIKIDTDRLTY